MAGLLVASDIGGTFTDTVVMDEQGRVGRYKSPTVPGNPALGILETLRLRADRENLSLDDLLRDVVLFAHGTTVATNAMIAGGRAKVGLIQTRGFRDTLSIMRGFKSLGLDEESIKAFQTLTKQEPAVPKELIAEVTERIDYRGREVMPLDEEDVRRAVRQLRNAGADVFAVSLLWSFKNDAHERRVAEIIEEELPGMYVSLSSRVLPRLGEYARTVTVAVNASLAPVVENAVRTLGSTLEKHGLRTAPMIMQSNGGLSRASDIPRSAASTIMSGPVGGVIASAYIGAILGRMNLVTTDMGGTSFDVGLILDGTPLMSNVTSIGRNDISLPSVNVRTVGAGSGSVATVRDGYLRVGPESAGAEPGPACYGRGGTVPTVADADVVLGYVNPDNFLDGRLKLHKDLAIRAIEEHVARPLGMSVEDAAEGIKTIVDSRMADQIRQVTIERGVDPLDLTMFAYGGAGPTHAFSYGAELGIAEAIIPLTASVHSAFGILASDLKVVEEVSHPMQSPPGSTNYSDALSADTINSIFENLQERTLVRLQSAGVAAADVDTRCFIDTRFRFQIHELTVEVAESPLTPAAVDRVVESFIELYESRFGKGSAFKSAGVEMVTFRVLASGRIPHPELHRHEIGRSSSADGPYAKRQIYEGGRWKKTWVWKEEALLPGVAIDGPAIVELPDTTIVVGEGQTAIVDEYENVILRLNGKGV